MRTTKNMPFLTVSILLLLVVISAGFGLSRAAAGPASSGLLQVTEPVITGTPASTPIPTETLLPPPVEIQLYSPLMQRSALAPLSINLIYTGTENGVLQSAFQPGTSLNYIVQATNHLHIPIPIDIRWTLVGPDPCGVTTLDQETVTAPPGVWYHPIPGFAAECMGIHSAFIELEYDGKIYTASQPALFVVSTESALVVSDKQGFDRGRLPTVAQMQNWWDNSPYWVFNLYLGGASLYYKNEPLDAPWAYQVAQQGWTFILTWVGPQAPCSRFSNRISINPVVAYAEGGAEAERAVQAANNLGFLGEKSIYYDMESYSGASDSCRLAVKEFMRGWTERLHYLSSQHGYDYRSGGYGSACTSYISEWATVSPPIDDVWMAHWIRNYYDPNVTVWGTACLDNSLWPNQQRMKQYAGDHVESWGGISLTIDSNVIAARVNALPAGQSAAQSAVQPAMLVGTGLMIESMDLLSSDSGYAVVEGQVLWTGNAGREWQAVDLGLAEPFELLGVHFADQANGWIVVRTAADGQPTLELLHTQNQGQSWARQPLPHTEPLQVAKAFPGSRDGALGWIALKMHSSQAFNLGQLLTPTADGQSWQQQDLPFGAPVELYDGGLGYQLAPETDLIYHTSDGGRSWQPAATTSLPAVFYQDVLAGQEAVAAGALPVNTVQSAFSDAQHGWALVQDGTCQGEKRSPAYEGEITLLCYQGSRLLATSDGGATWSDISPVNAP